MSTSPPKCCGWRFKGHSKYYLSLTLKSYKTKESFAASNRDKRILEKEIPDLIEKCKYKQTINKQFPLNDMRFYGIPLPIINTYYNILHIHSLLPWQVDLLSMNDNAVLKGNNLVYSAPTGIGKSLVYEILLFRRLQFWRGQVLIVLPFISLIEEKVSYLSSLCEPNGLFVESFHSHGAQRLDPRIDIAISTVEKANVIVNRCISEGQANRINMLIVDEAQTIEGERGYLIELLVMKLRLLNPSIQIIFLSATLPNPSQLSIWLDASLFVYENRLSQKELAKKSHIQEIIVKEGNMKTLDGDLIDDLKVRDRRQTLVHLVNYVYQSLGIDTTILIFCPTKSRCEDLIRVLLTHSPPLSKKQEFEIESTILHYNQNHPIHLDSSFCSFLRHGMCVHHAGLTDFERTIAESLFRRGNIRLLAATSTLSAGVNLNVDIVMIDGVSRCKVYYTATEYKQMIGRTGRMGQSKQGKVYVLLDRDDEEAFRSLHDGLDSFTDLKETCCNQNEGNLYLRTEEYWEKAIIELIGGGFKDNPDFVIRSLYECSFFSSFVPSVTLQEYIHISFEKGNPDCYHCSIPEMIQKNDNSLLKLLCECFLSLVEKGILLILLPVAMGIEEATRSDVRVVLTELGNAVYTGNISVDEVITIAKNLNELNSVLDISNTFQIVYQLTPLHLDYKLPIDLVISYIETNLMESEVAYINRDIVPIPVLYSLRNGCGLNTLTKEMNDRIRRLKTCVVIQDLIRFNDISKTSQFFHLNKGVLQSIQTSCRVFFYTNLKILKALHYDFLFEVVKSFETDVAADVTAEVLELMQYGIQLKEAVIFASNGYTTIESIANEDSSVLLGVLINRMPWQTAYCSDDQGNEGEDYIAYDCSYIKYIRYIDKLKSALCK